MSAKFPRISHLPWSPGATTDDKRLESVDLFLGRAVLLIEKLDGANVCLTSDQVYARSHAGGANGAMFDRLKALQAERAYAIPPHISVFCEWCMYLHTVEYDFKERDRIGLPLFVIGVRDDETGAWFGWSAMEEFAEKRMHLDVAPFVNAITPHTESDLRKAVELAASSPSEYGKRREGIVIRVPEPVAEDRFGDFSAKYVNKGFRAGEHLGGELREQRLGRVSLGE